MKLTVLGGFELHRSGEPVRLQPAERQLLAYLAVRGGTVSRRLLAAELWSDSPEERAAASLRSTLWRLRSSGGQLVTADAERAWIHPAIEVDLQPATARARALIAGCEQPTPPTDIPLLSCELLPDWDHDWLVFERQHFHMLRLHALEAIAEFLLRARRFGPALDAAHAAIAGDPLRESAHRLLVAIHLAEGNVAEALLRYRGFRDLVARELGLPPSAHMEALLEPVRRGDAVVTLP